MTTGRHGQFLGLHDHPRAIAAQKRLEQRHLYSSLFTAEIAHKLAEDDKSGILIESHVKTVSMHCRFIGRENEGIREAFQDELFKYSGQYGGIVIAFGNSSVTSGDAPSFEHDLRWIFHKVQTTVYYFRPERGSILRGTINNKTSSTFIGCLIHTIFNADVQIDEADQSIYGGLEIGDEIDFEVTSAFYTSDTVTIKGKLVGAVSDHSTGGQDAEEATEEGVQSQPADVNDDDDDENVPDDIFEIAKVVCHEVSTLLTNPDSFDNQPTPTTSNPATETAQSSAVAGAQYSAVSSQYSAKSAAYFPSSEPSETENPQSEKKKKKKKKEKRSLDEANSHSLSNDSTIDASITTETTSNETIAKEKKRKKKKRDKSLIDGGDAIPELVLEKKLKRESEGSSNSEEKVQVGPQTSAVFDDDDDFEPPVKKKKKSKS